MPKAGSTTIQDFVVLNLDLLNKFNIDYPLVKGNQNGENLLFAARKTHKDIFQSLQEYIKSSKTENLLISHEAIHTQIQNIIDAIYSFKDNLKSIKFKIIFFYRKSIEVSCSSWQQACKTHDCVISIDEFLERGNYPPFTESLNGIKFKAIIPLTYVIINVKIRLLIT